MGPTQSGDSTGLANPTPHRESPLHLCPSRAWPEQDSVHCENAQQTRDSCAGPYKSRRSDRLALTIAPTPSPPSPTRPKKLGFKSSSASTSHVTSTPEPRSSCLCRKPFQNRCTWKGSRAPICPRAAPASETLGGLDPPNDFFTR